LLEAASCGHVDVGRVLMDKRAEVNLKKPIHFHRDTALLVAAFNGHRNFVELLLEK